MLNFHKDKKLASAEAELTREFGIKLSGIPDRRPVDELFRTMNVRAKLSPEANVALLYRLVAMNYLAACKLMRDGGQNTTPDKLLWLTGLLDRSIDWSERAQDHILLEQVTSQLNMNIQRFLSSFGIHRGADIA